MSDEEIARKTSIKASDVRVVLNRLHSRGFFSYTRLRDKDSGWYSYIWKMSENRLKEFYDDVESGSGEQTEAGVESGYKCSGCDGKIIGFEDAMDMNFRCSGCGSSLEYFEGKRK
jgi:transcription initiation factor TFIIE subunit alpha